MQRAVRKVSVSFTKCLGRSVSRAASTILIKPFTTSSPPDDKIYHYFLDSDVIIDFIEQRNPKLVDFIKRPDLHFFYTETVAKKVGQSIPGHLRFAKASLRKSSVEGALDQLALTLPKKLIGRFERDLRVVFEAGFVCFDVIPFGNVPVLLTGNMNLVNTFILDKTNEERLTSAIEVSLLLMHCLFASIIV